MKNSENITIVLLAISGLVLVALLVGMYLGTPSAHAGTASSRQGNYIVAGAETTSGLNILYVVDVPTRRMAMYRIEASDADKSGSPVNILQTINLDQLFGR